MNDEIPAEEQPGTVEPEAQVYDHAEDPDLDLAETQPVPATVPTTDDPFGSAPGLRDRIKEIRERVQQEHGGIPDIDMGVDLAPPSAEERTEMIDPKLDAGQERRNVDVKISYRTGDIGIATNVVPAIESAVRSQCAKEKIPLDEFTITVSTDYPRDLI